MTRLFVQKVEKLKSLSLQYAAATQWLISSSIDITKLEEPSESASTSQKLKQSKLKPPSRVQRAIIRDATVTDSIL